jgi:sodium-coupled monocarboxylate transporter 8/12
MGKLGVADNALTTAALLDFRQRLVGLPASESRKVGQAKLLTVAFGVVTTALGLVVGQLGTLVEASNKIGGLLGGPLLGVFFLGVLSRREWSGGADRGGVWHGGRLPGRVSQQRLAAASRSCGMR